MGYLPISDYALLSNCHTAALASRFGSVDWLPFPRFDSPSVFTRILDHKGGHFSICPAEVKDIERRYLDNTLCIQTVFHTGKGTIILEDLLAVGPNNTGHELGSGSPHALIRRLRCVQGSSPVSIEYAPRFEYGLAIPFMKGTEEGIYAEGSTSILFLTSQLNFRQADSIARADVNLQQGDEYYFALEYCSTSDMPIYPWPKEKMIQYFRGTINAWRSWSILHQNYQGPWKDMVHASGRFLQALTYYPTGAIIAAPTTSLPESSGGSRNWDYRFCWIRDASFTHNALWVAACPDESIKYFDFTAHAALSHIKRNLHVQAVFGIGGEHDLSERELPHLSGWRGSRPVRVGNNAWKQKQMDIYGELLDAAMILKDYVKVQDRETRIVLADMADIASLKWMEKDQGIWEIRAPARHFTYSKLMCWVAVDRAIGMAEMIEANDRVASWKKTRKAIKDSILSYAWNSELEAFIQTFQGADLDASTLMMPIVGFIRGDDPRMLSTINAIEKKLTDPHGLVYRYKSSDGLEGGEGTFLTCTFWLAHALALAGDVERAKEVFDRAAAFVNDIGLLPEEIDPCTGEFLGNYPQALSHIGLVNAAWAISLAENETNST